MSGKPLVTFNSGSPFLEPALGTPVYVASIVSEPRLGRLNTWAMYEGILVRSQSYTWPIGRLEHLRAAELTAVCGDQLYRLLERYVGFQEAINIAP